jgi:hypothetical protein
MADILTMLTSQGSNLSKYNGGSIPINPLATKQSQMHADGVGTPGYSLNGNFTSTVVPDFNSYDDGDPISLGVYHLPSQLDLNGATPVGYPTTGPVGGHY